MEFDEEDDTDPFSDPEAVHRYSLYFWGAVVALLALGAGTFIYYGRIKKDPNRALRTDLQKKRKRPSAPKKLIPQIRSEPDEDSRGDLPGLPNFGGLSKVSEMYSPPSSVKNVVTPQTREIMKGLFRSVSSLKSSNDERPATSVVAQEELEGSPVVDALAQTMVSEVITETRPTGRYSNMTVDASLVFDEADLSVSEKGDKKNGS